THGTQRNKLSLAQLLEREERSQPHAIRIVPGREASLDDLRLHFDRQLFHVTAYFNERSWDSWFKEFQAIAKRGLHVLADPHGIGPGRKPAHDAIANAESCLARGAIRIKLGDAVLFDPNAKVSEIDRNVPASEADRRQQGAVAFRSAKGRHRTADAG